MPQRYQRRARRTNQEELYENVLEDRGVRRIVQYTTPELPTITPEMRSQLMREKHIWKIGDSFQKLAEVYYGDPRYWWVLAWYNAKPTDALAKVGDTIRIPMPLERILEFMEI